MAKFLGQVGKHVVQDLETRDINGLPMFQCQVCETFTRAPEHFHNAACVLNCRNCNSLRGSTQEQPALPAGGDPYILLHTCPDDGNRWWQFNDHFHLWKQVTDPDEWAVLVRHGYGRRRVPALNEYE